MTLWSSNTSAAAAAPKWKNMHPGSRATTNGSALFGNVTVNAFMAEVTVGVVGKTSANTIGDDGFVNPGWEKTVFGTGPVANVNITAGGTTYSNTDLIKVSGGEVNAAGTLVTNSTGGITAITLTSGGQGFVNTSTVAVTNSTGGASGGSGATLVAVLGGRAGRKMHETLVAGHSFTS